MKNKKIITVCLVLVCLCLFGMFVVSNSKKASQNIDLSKFTVSYIHMSTPLFDLNDKSMYVGYSDYVFVGKVEKVTYGGKYADGKYYSNGIIPSNHIAIPYTEYEISVSQNIKGELKTDETILVKKHAGIDLSDNTLSIIQGDIMPVKGEQYVFLTRASADGSLITIDPNGNVPLSEKGKNVVLNNNTTVSVNYSDVLTTAIYNSQNSVSQALNTSTTAKISIHTSQESIIDSYITAYATEIDPLARRQTYTSVYDVNPKD